MLNTTARMDDESSRAIENDQDTPIEEFAAAIGKLLGLRLTTTEAGRATVGLEATDRYANPMGTLHGAVLYDLADAAMGMAYRGVITEGESVTTLEL